MASPYLIAWGSGALVFAVGGALLLDRRSRRAGTLPSPMLWCGPGLGLVLAIVGAKLHPFLLNPDELREIGSAATAAEAMKIVAASGQRISGGLVLATLFFGLVLPKRLRGHLNGWAVLDAMAPLSGLAMAIGRLGCLAAGCCFGSLCESFFCLDYPPGSPPWWNHFARELLTDHGAPSLAVHPLPLYLAALGLLASAGAWCLPLPGWPPGSSFLIFATIFSGGRLLVERSRESILLVEIPLQTAIDQAVLCAALASFLWRWQTHRSGTASAIQPSSKDGSSRPGIPSA